MKKKVVMAMSGGVDSSLGTALLLEQGYEVIGVTMQIWSPEKEDDDHGGCCSLSAVDDARRVANTLGIPYYVMNFRELFEEKVIKYFCESYLEAKTPNPCIACNRFVKFEALLHKAKALGADYIATGHYSIIDFEESRNRWVLKKAVDASKDQSYALYTFTQDQLSHTLLPLGGMTKIEAREMARNRGLTVANKPDSQEICFVSDNDYGNFLKEQYPDKDFKKGQFVTTDGKVVGEHQGLPFYTIGQRKGLGVALGYPAYVVDLDPKKNQVILGTNDEVFSKGLIAEDVNLILYSEIKEPIEAEVKIRYSAKPAKALLTPISDGIKVEFKEPQRAITPGQAVVFYQGDYVVGGGTIKGKG